MPRSTRWPLLADARRESEPIATTASPALGGRVAPLLPGLGLALAIAAVAILVRRLSGLAALNPIVVALVIGIAVRAAWGAQPALRPGIAWSVRPLLRAAIVLLGLGLTVRQLVDLGPGALGLAVVVVAATLPATLWLARLLGVDRTLAQLIGAGTAICGASAIVAASQVAGGKDEDVTYSLAVITLCGTAAMLLDPLLAGPLGLDARSYGLWVGASVHEVVQAVGAAAAGGPEAAQAGTMMKLARVVLLAPVIMVLGHLSQRQAGRTPIPWFAVGFLALVALRSTGLVPGFVVEAAAFLVPVMLATAVAALGLSTDLRALRQRGGRPLLVGIGSSVFISVLALLGVVLLAA